MNWFGLGSVRLMSIIEMVDSLGCRPCGGGGRCECVCCEIC